MNRLTKKTAAGDYCPVKGTNDHQRTQRLAAYEDLGTVEELARKATAYDVFVDTAKDERILACDAVTLAEAVVENRERRPPHDK